MSISHSQSLATYEVLHDINVIHALQPKLCRSQVDFNVFLRHANVLSSLTSSCDSARAFGETFWFMTSLVSLSRSFPWLIPIKVCLWSVSIASSSWVFPSFDTDSSMSVNVLSSHVGSNAVTNYVDSAESMRKSPRRVGFAIRNLGSDIQFICFWQQISREIETLFQIITFGRFNAILNLNQDID